MSEYLSMDPNAGQDSGNEYLSMDPMAGEAEPVKKKERSIAEYLRDGAISVNKGIGNTVALAGTLGGLVTGDMDNAVRRTGERFAKRVSEKFSDVRKQQLADNEAEAKRIEAEDGDLAAFWHGVKTGVTDPLTVAEQLPNLALGGGIGAGVKAGAGRVVAEQTAQRAATSAAVGTGVAMEGADPANQFYNEAMKLPDAQFQQNPDYQEEFKRNGGDHDAAKKAVALDIARRVALSSGAVSYLASKIPGARKLEEAITGGKSGAAGRLMNAGVGATGELAQGAVEGGFGQFAGNVGKSEINPNQSLSEGVANNAGLEAGTGGVMGAVGGYVSGSPAAVADTGPLPVNDMPTGQTDRSLGAPAIPEASEAEVALTTPKALTALDRVDEINAEDARLSSRLAELDAPESGYGEMFNQERADIATQRQALDTERGSITASWPQAVAGADTTFSTEAGVRLGARYALMEADDLQSSHDTNLRPNPVYPPDLQPRERDRAASGVQIAAITQKIDPARLGESADAATGAPIVGADGLVESGNARTIALKRVYQANGQKATEYKDYIKSQAQRLGITPESVDGMKRPVLVRVRTTPVNRAEFARQANASTVAAMSPSEQARADAARMEDVDGLNPDENGDFMSGSSRDFVRRFVARLPGTEQSGMIDATGGLSQTGYARVRNAVLAKAYGDSPVLLRMVESLDDNMRNISKALMQAAPVVAKSRQAIGEGALFDADITPDLMAAVEELSRLKDAGVSVHDALAQAGMFGDTYSPETRELIQFLADNLRRPRKIAEFITTYFQALNAAGNPAQGSLLGEAVAPAKGDLLNAARRTQDESIPVTGSNLPTGEEAGTEHRGQSGDAARDQKSAESDGTQERLAANEELAAAWANLAEVTRPKTGTLNLGFDPVPAAVALVRLFKAAFKAGTLNARAAAKYVRDQIKKDPQYKHLVGTVDDAMLASAARVALDEFEREGTQSLQGDLFSAVPAGKQGGLFDSLPGAKPAEAKAAEAMINGRPYDRARDNYKTPEPAALFDAALLTEADGFVAKYYHVAPPHPMSDSARAEAERLLGPNLKKAEAAQVEFDQNVIDIAKKVKALGQILAPLKSVKRAAEKMHDDMVDRGNDTMYAADVKDLLRATIVVRSYDDVPAAVKEIRRTSVVFKEKDKTLQSARESNGGYADYTVFVKMPNGVIAEIQINTPPMLAAKGNQGHKLFEAARSLPSSNPLKAEIMDSMRGLYGAALALRDPFSSRDAAKQAKNASSDAGAPVRGPALSMPGNGNSESPSSDALNQPLPGMNTYSSPENPNTNSDPSGNLLGISIGSTSTPSIAQDKANEPELLRKARAFATKFHKGQKRKFTGEDYISHPAGLVRLLRGVPHTDEMLAAAWLHDTVEDTNATFGDVRAQFGVPVTELVRALTKVGVQDKAATIEQLRAASAEAQTVKLADIIHNTANVREANPLFAETYLADKAKVLDALDKGDATLMKVARGIVAGDKTAYDEYINRLGEGNEHGKSGAGSAKKQSAGSVPATDGERESDSVRARARGSDQRGSDNAGDADSQKQRLRRGDAGGPDEGDGDPQHGERAGAGDSAGGNAGIPAGRDIPLKSGRNYAFGDTDLTYTGSWREKARQNVEAVELLKKLEAENRQATHDEQAVLAKFIGWGSSEIANTLFGDKINADLETLKNYDEAIANLGDAPYLTNANYPRYRPAFSVLQAKDPKLSWYTAGNITKAMLDAARPSSTVRQWGALRDRLKAVMSDQEWAEASRSTQYAHYTSKPIVKSMWKAMERMGFHGGAVLEPGAGIGIFPGLMPADMAVNTAYTGIEFDSITGGILKQLYPDERILVESFVDTQLPEGFYDVAAGNPPFHNTPILSDPKYKKYAFVLHDYFFAKTIDAVKPGGLVMFVTSRYTMDKMNNKARQYLADRADLVGAIRLPQTAFQKNAGTEVVTDVLFLRKRVAGETFEHGKNWLNTAPVQVEKHEFQVNEYFAAHPDMVLGAHSSHGSMYGKDEYTVTPLEGDIETHFARAVENLPADIYRADHGTAAEAAKVREIDFNPKAKKEGNYYVTDAGVLMQREGGVGVRAQLKSAKDTQVIKDFVGVRDALKQAHFDQLSGGDWESSLQALQKTYAAFVAKHGRINQFTEFTRSEKIVDEDTGETFADEKTYRRYPLLSKLQHDPDNTLVSALETVNDDTGVITESGFLRERVLGRPEKRSIETPADALLSALNDTGTVDLAYVGEHMGMTEKEVIAALGTLIYRDPGRGWVMADEYLSGNVKRKLIEAKAAALADKKFERNVEALVAVQPAPITATQISAKIGMNWIPESVYEEFIESLSGAKVRVSYNQRTGQWAVTKISGQSSIRAQEWSTPSRDVADILEAALTSAPIRVTKTVGSGKDRKSVFDQDATEAANQKRQAMRAEFTRWLWENGERTDTLVQLYNDKFNTIVPRAFDGRHLTLPGSSKKWSVFDHVKRGAWRIIQRGNTYLAHAVGSGKTFQMVISAMEQKRLGLIQKPMMVVPNHMLQQFAREWQDLYPAARLMVADEVNFHTDNRRRFVSRVALSDLDGVIITHSAFKLLDLDPEYKKKMMDQELDYLRAALEEAEDAEDGGNGRKSPKIKQIEAKIERMEEKLKAAMSGTGKDKNVRFDELGVDMLYVDEAHEFRKLGFTTTRQVKGIDSNGSDRAFDLWMKTRWLEEKKPGRSLVMASGTPVTNTLAELYSVQRFMANDVLEERGIDKFDDWASMFGEEKTEIEADASGKYAPVTRFTRFVNVPELTQMFREYADVLTSDHLAAMLGDKRPKVKGGSRKLTITPQTLTFWAYKEQVMQQRLEKSRAWKPSKDQPFNPDPIIRIIGDGRLMAIDMRFVDPSLPSDPDSKLNKIADSVIAVYQKSGEAVYNDKEGNAEPSKGATQMVFSDIGFGAGVAAARGFNARAWFEKRLRDAGVNPAHVAFMADYKKSSDKLKLFKDVNAGRIRILVGSSKNMGTGVNAQQRLLALSHLDTPWYPADLEQREGRIIRQGNKNPLVDIHAFSAKGSYDAVMWQMLASKQRFIDQALSGDSSVRSIDDISESSQYEMATAMTSDDPRAIQLAGLKAEVEKLERLHRAHEEQRMRNRTKYVSAGETLEYNRAHLAEAERLAKSVQDLSGDKFKAKVGNKTYSTRKEWGEALMTQLAKLQTKEQEGKVAVGEISGFQVMYSGRRQVIGGLFQSRLHIAMPEGSQPLVERPDADPVGVAMRATNMLSEITRRPEFMRSRIADAESTRNALEPKLNARFEFVDMLSEKSAEANQLEKDIQQNAATSLWALKNAVTGEEFQVQAQNEDAALVRAVPWNQINSETLKQWTVTRLPDGAPAPEAIAEEDGTRLSTGTGKGMDVATLTALRDRIAAKMENLPPVHVFASPEDDGVPLRLRSYIVKRNAVKTVEGAMHDGAIYLFASGLRDEARAEFVLAEHEVTHYVLRGLLGKDLERTMRAIWNNNPRIRRAAARMKGLSEAGAVEEILADMTNAELSGLKGWRALVGRIRDWLRDHGFTAVSDWLTQRLEGSTSQQAEADAYAAELVRRARAMVAGSPGKAASTRTLSVDAVKQEAWLMREAKARGFKDIDELAEKAYPVFEKLAEKWRERHPADVMLSRGQKTITSYEQRIDDLFSGAKAARVGVLALDRSDMLDMLGLGGKPVLIAEHKVIASGTNHGLTAEHWKKIPEWLDNPAAVFDSDTVPGRLVFIAPERVNGAPLRMIVEPDADVERLNIHLLLNAYDAQGGNPIRRWVNDGLLRYIDKAKSRQLLAPSGLQLPGVMQKAIGSKRKIYSDVDLVKYRQGTKLSIGQSTQLPTVSERADAILSKSALSWAPVDAIIKAGVKVTGIDRATRALYRKAGFLLDRYTPETLKAGIVADYGIPGAVLDQRAIMQGRINVQLRKSGQLIEKLATLTRAESRVAYEWMNNDDPQAAAYFEGQLPPDSLAVMQDVRKMIDSLSQEAVRLGQLDAESFKRNRFAYLRRSYIKHTTELTKHEAASRQRAIAVMGDQYKSRGMTDGVDMAKVQNIAPEWWQRKLQAGKADKGLKGETFIRLERRAHAGDGTIPMEGFGDRGPGKLREVAYWPAGEPVPAKFKDWSNAGTWEVRDTKGGKLVMWRDFTKQERVTMGEIDEARFAIAKTLHGMVQDVETGRYLQWLAERESKVDGDTVDGLIVDASERMRDTFKVGEWVRVPDTKISGTNVLRYGKLAGRYLPGPIWNDVRQIAGARYQPLGETYAAIHRAWKTAKTALSPGVHTNNVMANFVMADWHDVTAGHVTKALRLLLAAHERDGSGLIGRAGNLAAHAGRADREAAAEIVNRFRDSGGTIGTWATTELKNEQMQPLIEALEKELGVNGESSGAQVGAMVAVQKLLQLKLPSAWDAFKPTLAGKAITTEARNLIGLYEAEDQVFRLAAWLKAKENGVGDMEAGKVARRSFLDYHINAPWVQMMRQTALPFVAFTYRAVPMLLETSANKPWKVIKLAMFAGALNAMGYAMLGLGGDDEDDERRLLPDEKAGKIWGMVPKLIRMPWNDDNDSPVFLDVRRWVPVGDVFDIGATNAAVPLPPAVIPGGPLALLAEVALNKVGFTGKPITLETDTTGEKAMKMADYLYKAFAPNIVVLPGTYAWTGVKNASAGKTDVFGREQSTAAALASSMGVKVGSYPRDVLQRNAQGAAQAKIMEIRSAITKLKREYQQSGIDEAEFREKVEVQNEKMRKVMDDLREKL